MHSTSFDKIERFRYSFLLADKEMRIADIGGLSKDVSCKFIFNEDKWEYESIKVGRDGNFKTKINDESFDVVVTGQTLERVKYFWVLISEINRVLKSGGYFCAIVSSSGAFAPRGDLYRFHPDALEAIAELVGFEVIECEVDPMNLWRDARIIARKK